MNALDSGVPTDWGITIEIPAFKKVNYKGVYRRYDVFCNEDQKGILAEYFLSIPGINGQTGILYYELHKDKRIHLHTYLLKRTYDEMCYIQKSFCQKLGFRPKQYQYIFNIFRPDNFHRWMEYCKKEDFSELEQDLMKLNLL